MKKNLNGKSNPAYKDGRTLAKHYCRECNKEINYCTWLYGSQLCSSCSKRGKRNVNWNSRKLYCKICNKALRLRGKNETRLCFICYRKHMSGKNNPNYKHGKTALSDKIRQTERYVIWRNKVYKEDNYTCQLCKEHGRKLHAHHKLPLIDLILFFNLQTIEEALKCKVLWDSRWGITLCRKCHPKIENGE